jgi:TonB-linked SusC/RagA family outer membrane protein
MIFTNQPKITTPKYLNALIAHLEVSKRKKKHAIMFFMMIFFSVQMQAFVYSQKIVLDVKNMELAKVFTLIKKQSGYSILYNTTLIKGLPLITIRIKSNLIQQVMEKTLLGQPLTFIIKDKLIVISELKNNLPKDEINKQTEVLVKGIVFEEDEQGKRSPFPGVSVKEKNGRGMAVTGIDGKFSVSVNDGATLVFSSIGYLSRELKISKSNRELNVVLEGSTAALKDVVITGFQNANKKTFSGAATKLKASEVKQDGVVDISRMLEGRVAGVSVQNVSGTFGSAPKIRIRGATSITGDNKPLWVVDGVILEDVVNVTNDQLSSGDPSTLFGSSVAGLSSDDIESFEILKDAAATSYYGAKAMNGVIVVTTKKGRIGKPLISYSGNFSVSLKPNYNNYNIMNSNEQMSVYNELDNKGWFNLPSAPGAPDGGPWDKMYNDIYLGVPINNPEAMKAFLAPYAKYNTNWFDELFNNSLLQEHSLGVSTGTEKAQFYVSTSFVNDGGWSKGSDVKRYTGNARATFNPSDRFSFGISAVASIRQQTAPGTYGRTADIKQGTYTRDFDINPFSYALSASRALPLFEPNGERAYFKKNFAPFNILSELEENRLKIGINDLKLQGDLSVFLNRKKNLKYSFLGAIRSVKTLSEHEITGNSNAANAYRANGNPAVIAGNKFLYLNPEDPSGRPQVVLPFGGFYNPSDNDLLNFTFRNNLEWNAAFGKEHTLNVFTSQEYGYTNREVREMIGYGYQYNRGGVPYIDSRAIKVGSEMGLPYYSMLKFYDRSIGLLTRATYAYKEKYVFNGTMRYDGSNKLGNSPIARWLPTWNLSAAWNIDQEAFMKNNKVISYMKLRGTYGLTASLGNADNAVPVFNSLLAKRPVASEQETAIDLLTLANTELTWEKQYETNVGLDISFFESRYQLVVDAYLRQGKDLIAPIRTSGIGGQDVKLANYADMKTKGIEMSIGGILIKNANWNINSRLTFGYNKNEVTNLKTPTNIFTMVRPEGGAIVGGPYRGLYSVVMTGLYRYAGYPTFLNHEGQYNSTNVYMGSENTQYLKYEGPVDPIINGGLFNSVSYKQFTISALISYQLGNKIRLNPGFLNIYSQMLNTPKELKDRYVMVGDEALTNIPALIDRSTFSSLNGDTPYNTYNYSDLRTVSGDFLRLKTVTLSYRLKDMLAKRLGLGSASVSCTGNGLWLIYADKKLHGQDPEFFNAGGVASPIVKQVTMALKVGF